jgi:anti-sigma factor RsiW
LTETPLHDEALLLSPYLDHALEPGEAARLEAHLAGCDACRRQLEGLRQTVTMLRGLPAERMPRPVTIPVRRVGAWQWRSALIPAAGMAAAMTLALGGFFAGQYSRSPGAASRSAQTSQNLENRGSAGSVTAPQSLREWGAPGMDASKARAAAQPAMTVQTDRPVYTPHDAVTITARTNVTGAPVTIQFDRDGYRVRVPSFVTGPGETRATLRLATLDPPATAGTYRVIATLALDPSGDKVLVAETSLTVR